MIARLVVIVPFTMVVPENTEFVLYRLTHQGYDVTIHPPVHTDSPIVGPPLEEAKVGGAIAFLANGLKIDFKKELFDRSPGTDDTNPTFDPPTPLVLDVLNFFLQRLRYVQRASMVHQVDSIFDLRWTLRYLNDDGTELQPKAELVRGRFGLPLRFSLIPVHPQMWNDLFSLARFEVPVWDTLRLDALAAFPNVGTAVVLAFASLETFIAQLLDALAKRSDLSPSLWKWINKRGSHLQEPSTEEQFDQLLKEFGHSLKENATLWTAFQHLRTARNKFVHEGSATIGGEPVDEAAARLLVKRVDEIIAWVRQWVPVEVQWPTFEYSHIKSEFSHLIVKVAPPVQ
jgi:hypothetical protein